MKIITCNCKIDKNNRKIRNLVSWMEYTAVRYIFLVSGNCSINHQSSR